MKKFLFVLLQCTWGCAQTLLGFLFFLKFRKKYPHKFYRGTIDTRWRSRSGMSLGLFIFSPDEESEQAEQIRIHEYGHCIQSLLLGPGYLIVGLISVIWANHPHFRALRREKKLPYTSCFVESWASKWGEWVTGERAIWN